jgi:hypothetical protein
MSELKSLSHYGLTFGCSEPWGSGEERVVGRMKSKDGGP